MADQAPDTGEQGGTDPTGTGAGGDTRPPANGPGSDTERAEDPGTEAAKWKALAQKHEARAKANAEAAAKLAAIEESQKTEQQRLADRAEQAEKRAAEAELRVLRAEVASAKGIPASLAQRLQGSDRGALEADADALLKDNPALAGKPRTPPADAIAGHGKPPPARTPADEFASLLKGTGS